MILHQTLAFLSDALHLSQDLDSELVEELASTQLYEPDWLSFGTFGHLQDLSFESPDLSRMVDEK